MIPPSTDTADVLLAKHTMGQKYATKFLTVYSNFVKGWTEERSKLQ